ncbi:hypothetical protein ACEPAG_9735 [Sanghuangporus baumii]
MFGNTSWTNPQQNQQQQQPPQPGTSAFGQQQPNAFGSGGTPGFGAFGQTQPPPPVNPMFGGTSNTGTTGATGFGSSFGSGTSAFGPKPSGFGGFGAGGTGTSAFGSGGNTFGQTGAGTTSAFGQPAGGTSTFGSTSTGLFGQKPAAPTTGFGSTSTGPTTGTDGTVPPVTTGSSNPPYQVYSEKDANAPAVTLNYQSISCMPAYRGTSFEEVRVQDYLQGRKTAGAFGQSATFGLAPSQSTTTAFGQPATGTSGFGGFGQQNQQQQQQQQPTQSTGFGAFGQPSTSQPSAFGSGTGTTGFGGFGQNTQQQQQQPASTGLFGGTSAFGQNTQQQQPQQQPQTGTTGFGGFGQTANQPKPFGGFGQTSGTSTFGSGGTGFGQTAAQPAGQPSTGLFGQPANQNQGTSAFSSFGANANKPAFGQPLSQPGTTGFGLFGQTNQQQPQPNQQQSQQPSTGLFGGTGTGTGLFGQNTQQQPQQGQPGQQGAQPTGLFGQQATQPSTNLFGGGTGTGLFGNNNQNKPAFGTGLFGSTNQNANTGTTQPTTGLFGQPLGQTNQQAAPGTNAFGGSSLFGQKPATATTFGQSTTQPASTGFGSSFLGSSTLGGTGGGLGQSMAGAGGTQNSGTLTASVAQPVQENLPIFSLLNSSQPVSLAPPPKKVSSFFTDVPTRTPLGISTSRLTNSGKLRGFGISQSAAGLSRGNGLSASLARSKNGPTSLALSRSDSRGLLGPESFMKSTSLGSDGRFSPKKLVLDKKIDPSEVFGRAAAKASGVNGSKVEFNPRMSMAAREKEAASKSTQPAPTAPSAKKPSTTGKDTSDLQEGDYYVKPPLEVLRKMSNQELSSIEGLVVGRKGYGEIQFLDPVDLTSLPRLKDLLGKLVDISDREVVVYPESAMGGDEKPPPGEGLNVRARIILHGCWARDRATGEPVKDPESPIYIKHLRRLSNVKRTQFQSYVHETGTWTFDVDHF